MIKEKSLDDCLLCLADDCQKGNNGQMLMKLGLVIMKAVTSYLKRLTGSGGGGGGGGGTKRCSAASNFSVKSLPG